MRELSVCECIGKIKFKSKAGKDMTISYFTYDLDRDGSDGQGCFQAFDDCEIGERYQFVFANGQQVIVK